MNPLRVRGSLLLLLLGALARLSGASGLEDPGPADGKKRFPLEAKVSDPDGDKLTVQWVQISGPQVRIAEPASPKTYFIPTEPGKYVFEIRVNDGKDEVSRQMSWNVTKPNEPPEALAGKDQNVILGQKVVVDGSGSRDPDGKIVEYKWRVVTTPKSVKLKLTALQLSERMFDFEPSAPGDYVFELTVFDGKDWSAPVQTTVRVAASNKPPMIVDFEEQKRDDLAVQQPRVNPAPPAPGTPPTPVVKKPGPLKLGQPMVLDGSGSSDPLGEELEFFWRQAEDEKTPGFVTLIADKKSAQPGHGDDHFACPVWVAMPEKPGSYRFYLELSAGKGDRKRRAVSETIEFLVGGKNAPPVAHLKPPPTRVEKGAVVTLDGSLSSDPDKDDRLEFIWSFLPNGNKVKLWIVDNGPRVQFKAEEEGEYVMQLIVDDGKEKSKPAVVRVAVAPANRPPLLEAPEKVEALVGEVVRVIAQVSDPDNDRTEVEWTVVPPPNLKLSKEQLAANPLVFTPTEKGQYVFRVVARDARSQSEPKLVQVLVTDSVNLPPTAVLDGPRQAAAGEKVSLSAERSSDPEKRFLTYLWKQTQGPALPGAVPGKGEQRWEFTPAEPGVYQVTLAVSDGVHESEPRVFDLRVETKAPENHPPVAKLGEVLALAPGEETLLNGSASSDPDPGDKLTYRWRVLEHEEQVELQDREQPRLRFKPNTPGAFRVELVVNDGKVDSAPAVVSVEVRKPNLPPEARPEAPERAQVGREVVLRGFKSFDPDGKIAEYHWAQVPEGGTDLGLREFDLHKETLHFQARKPGAYIFRLFVVDDQGAKSKPALITVNVTGQTQAPVALLELQSEGPFEAGKAVVLSGARSTDPERRALAYQWKQVSGPETLEIPADAGPTLTLTPKAAGEYTLELRVRNGFGESPAVSASFRVQDPADRAPEHTGTPVARIAEIEPCEPGGEVLLDATPSSSGGPKHVALYNWRVVTEPEGAKVSFGLFNRLQNNQKAQLILPKAGEYVFELKVSDGKTWSEPARAAVRTRAANVAPEACVVAATGYSEQDMDSGVDLLKLPHVLRTDPKANALTLIGEEQREFLLDGSGSSDPDKGPKPLAFRWKQLSGPRPERVSGEDAVLRVLPAHPGILVWSLVVYDGKVESPPAQVRIQVLKKGTLPVAKPLNAALEANVAVRGVNVNVPNVRLDASPSFVAVGKTARYVWKQIEGEDLLLQPEKLNKVAVGLRVYLPGKYRFLLTVFDGEYFSLPAIVDVNVREPSLVRPQAPKGIAVPDGAPKVPEPAKEQGGALLPPPKPSAAPPASSGSKSPEAAENGAALPSSSSVREPDSNSHAAREQTPRPGEKGPASRTGEPVEIPPAAPASERPTGPPVAERPSNRHAPAVGDPQAAEISASLPCLSDPAYRANDPLYQRDKKRLEALVNEPGQASENRLILALDNKDRDLRSVAAFALVQRGMGSVPGLLEVLEKGSPEARRQAHGSLKALTKMSFEADAARWRKWWADQTSLPPK